MGRFPRTAGLSGRCTRQARSISQAIHPDCITASFLRACSSPPFLSASRPFLPPSSPFIRPLSAFVSNAVKFLHTSRLCASLSSLCASPLSAFLTPSHACACSYPLFRSSSCMNVLRDTHLSGTSSCLTLSGPDQLLVLSSVQRLWTGDHFQFSIFIFLDPPSPARSPPVSNHSSLLPVPPPVHRAPISPR